MAWFIIGSIYNGNHGAMRMLARCLKAISYHFKQTTWCDAVYHLKQTLQWRFACPMESNQRVKRFAGGQKDADISLAGIYSGDEAQCLIMNCETVHTQLCTQV